MGADALLARVAATRLLEPGRPVVVLLSGGRDSVCLLAAAVELGAVVRALHVDYGLRDASAGDAAHCAALCERLGVPLATERARRPPGAPGNLHAWAREARYAAGGRLAAAADADLAAGHTRTDQAETILYRLAASPGRRALLGMAPRSGRLVRPLLDLTREDTAAFCRSRGLGWREDASNACSAFARARVRHGLLPALAAVDPRAEANVVRTAALLRDEAEVLDAVVDAALAGRDGIAVDELRALPRALGRLVVRRLAEDATGRLCARAPGRLDELLGLDAPGRAGGADLRSLDLGDGARAEIRGGILRMVPTPPLGARTG